MCRNVQPRMRASVGKKENKADAICTRCGIDIVAVVLLPKHDSQKCVTSFYLFIKVHRTTKYIKT